METALRFGASKSHGGRHLAEAAEQFAAHLGSLLGRPIQSVVSSDYEAMFESLIAGQLDLAWMPPLVHSRSTAKGAHLVAVSQRAGSVAYRSALLVRADSSYRNLTQLRGCRVAWVDKSSVSGYLFPRLYLLAAGVDPRTQVASETFYGSTALACAAVAGGEADLCACYVSEATIGDPKQVDAQLRRAVGEKCDHLRVLYFTDPIPPDGIVVAASMSNAERAQIAAKLLSLHEHPEGARALEQLMQAERLSPVDESTHKVLAGLRALA